MENIAAYLKEKYGQWGWMGQRAHDAVGINKVLPLDFIICCDFGTDTPHYFEENNVFSVEKNNKVRKDWSNEDLKASFEGPLGNEIFTRWKKRKEKINLLCYRSIEFLEKKGTKYAAPKIYAVPEKLKKHFDNKVRLYENLPNLRLSRIPGEIGATGKNSFENLKKKLSLPFVVQFPYGSSGHFTFIIHDENEYAELQKKYPDTNVVIRKYVDGFSLNVNAVVVSTDTGPKTVCSFPSIQITGLAECSNFPSAFCGNDYSAACSLNKDIIDQVERQVEKIGSWMAEAGYRGIFGMDFVAEGEKVYPVEINPRFQNSTSLFNAISAGRADCGENMLFMLHVAEFLQEEDKHIKEYLNNFPFSSLMAPLDGAQVILHNAMDHNTMAQSVVSGAYRLVKDTLLLIKKGASFDALSDSRDILITCGVPRINTVIEPNAPICKVQLLRSALDAGNKRQLSAEMKRIVPEIYNMFGLKNRNNVFVPGMN